jgi:AcrR family transcriptional regulator
MAKRTENQSSGPKLNPRERILQTARSLFYQKGVTNVGVDEIVATSGVAKATLYKYFPSKDDLILEFMRRGENEWLDWLKGAVEGLESNPKKRVFAVYKAYEEGFKLPEFRGCMLTNTFIELGEIEHQAREVLVDYKEKVRGYLEELAKDAGVKNSQEVSKQLMVLLEGASNLANAQRSSEPAVTARQMAEMVIRANQ